MKNHNHKMKVTPEEFQAMIKDKAVRRAVTKECHLWFFHIYFAEYIQYKTAKFQREIFELTEDQSIKTLVMEAFRGSGKTTIISTSYVIWSILGVQRKKFPIIFARTEAQARTILSAIKKELEENELLKADMGPFEEPDDEWRAMSIVLPQYNARITVASIEKSVRGIKHNQHRPDLIICDDLEDLNSVKTQESRDKLYQWLVGDIIPLGSDEKRLIIIGTRLHDDSLIMRIRREIIEDRRDGVAKAYPFFDEKGKVIWSEKYFSKEKINEKRREYPDSRVWEREFMLKIIPSDDQIVKQEWIQTYDELPKDMTLFRYVAMGVDLAISTKNTADCTAMVSAYVYGRKNNLKIYIIPKSVNERMNFVNTSQKIKTIMNSNKQRIKVWIENIGYQKAMIEQLQSEGYPVKEYSPYGSDKQSRLQLTSEHIQSGRILFPKQGAEELINQILNFPGESHDDLVDAFSIAIQGILDEDSKALYGHALITEKELNDSYVSDMSLVGFKRLGVVLAGGSRANSTISIQAENVSSNLYCEQTSDVSIVAKKILEILRREKIDPSGNTIIIDRANRGQELCEAFRELMLHTDIARKSNYDLFNGLDFSRQLEGKCVDFRTKGYCNLAKSLRGSGRLIRDHRFDDLLLVGYTEQPGDRIKVVDKEKLLEQGVDSSILDSLALTFITELEERKEYKQKEWVPTSFYQS